MTRTGCWHARVAVTACALCFAPAVIGADAAADAGARAGAGAGTAVPFVPVKLPRHVALQLPQGWTIQSRGQGKAKAATGEIALDLSAEPPTAADTANLVHAVSNVRGPYAAVIVNSIAPAPVTPEQVGRFDRSMLQAYGAGFERRMRYALKGSGRELRSLGAPRIERVGGWPAVAVSYVRSGEQGDIYVQHFDIYTPDQQLLLILSCRDQARSVWLPLLDRIRSSLVVGNQVP